MSARLLRFSWFSLLVLAGCESSPDVGSGGNGGGGTTSSATTTTHASGGTTCQDPGQLADGAEGPATCTCPCAMEAPANLQLIAEAAVATAQMNGALCQDATLIPFAVAPASCFQPGHSDGMDFHTGNTFVGWKCLGVSDQMTQVIRCRYRYVASSGYLGPALGGPDPGADGFEVSAQGDFDGNGVLSTFTIAGTRDPQTGQYTLSPLFQDKPDE